MKRTIFVWTLLAIVGVSSVNAQMRISGSDAPNKSAVLDLNPDNNVSVGNATLGLALPRVKLKNTKEAYPLLTHVKGMLVYNTATNGEVTPGVYQNDGSQWIRLLDKIPEEKDSIIGNEVTDATANGGLIRSGSGTTTSPYTLGVAQGGITSDKLADGSVTINKFTNNTIIELGDDLATNVYYTVLGDSIINYITNNLDNSELMNSVVDYISNNNEYIEQLINSISANNSYTVLSDSIINYITQNINTTELGDTIMQYLTNNLDHSALMDSVANYISHNNSYLRTLIDNIAQNVYNTTLGDTIVDYISNNIAGTELGDSIANYIANNIHNTILGDAIVNLIHDSEVDAIIGNEVTNATTNGGLIRSGSGTMASPYTLGIANGGVTTAHLADNSITSAKIVNGTIVAADLGQMGAASGQVLKWNGSAWAPAADAGITSEVDGIIGNEVTNATANGGLTRAGSGTTTAPYTLGIANGGVTNTHIADNSITSAKIVNGTVDAADLAQMGALNGHVLKWNGTTWQPAALAAEVDGIVGNEVTNATTDGGLIRSGSGTATSPYTLGIANGGITTSHILDQTVNSAKITDGTITNIDINASAAIALSKIALPTASSNNGKVLKSNGTAWIAGDDNNSDTNTTYSAGTGLTLSGTTFGIGAGQVSSTMIADNAVTSAKIANGTIAAADLSQMGATNSQVLKWDGSSWAPAADAGITSVSGSNGVSVTNGTTAPVVSLPSGTKGQVLAHNGTTWTATAKWSPTLITDTSTANNGITSSGYSDAYVWTGLTPGLYSLRVRTNALGLAKFVLQSEVAFGTSIQFEINSNSHDHTAEIMFYYVYSGSLRLKALCTGNCPTRLFNLTLHKFE